MAERSFKTEVQSLSLGEGETFHGEGILAVTKALLQSGVSYVGGYPGAPISHLLDVELDAGAPHGAEAERLQLNAIDARLQLRHRVVPRLVGYRFVFDSGLLIGDCDRYSWEDRLAWVSHAPSNLGHLAETNLPANGKNQQR